MGVRNYKYKCPKCGAPMDRENGRHPDKYGEVIFMIEPTKWELTDEELSRCISQCHENLLNSESDEETNKWRWFTTVLLLEQSRRTDLMLKEVYEDNIWDYGYRQMRACYGSN